jgi:lipopolysaccharide/colanic/teichoic acid biosynthesis glycosyltransferase
VRYELVKRIMDICGSAVLVVLLSPVIAIAGLMVLLDGTGGPVLLEKPLRLGQDGRPFRMLKFRTMIPNGDEMLMNDPKQKHLAQKLLTQRKLTLSEDPRLTRVGRFLRSFDIDELPQLFNVLGGSMSLVGPRPYLEVELTYICTHIDKGRQLMDRVLSVAPGITGIWQVSGRNEIDLNGRVILDAAYATHHSLLGDLKIFLKTPIVVLTRKGAW